MFIGHAAVALAAKPLAPRVNLGLALVAAYSLDLVWPVLVLVGVERVALEPGDTAFAKRASASACGRRGPTGTGVRA